MSTLGVAWRLPPAAQVPRLMDAWAAWLTGPAQALHPVIAATVAHHRLEAIHPFVDGNGRVGRLVLNLLLLRAGYAPALILRAWRMGYLSALSRADAGQFGPLANIIGRAVERGFALYLDALAATPEDAWQPLAALADATSVSAAHLGWLIRKGRLAAQKRGGRWYSTAAAVARYQDEVVRGEVPRGRPPQSRPDAGTAEFERDPL